MQLHTGPYEQCKRVCTGSWLWEKIPCSTGQSNPHRCCVCFFQSDALPLYPHPIPSPKDKFEESWTYAHTQNQNKNCPPLLYSSCISHLLITLCFRYYSTGALHTSDWQLQMHTGIPHTGSCMAYLTLAKSIPNIGTSHTGTWHTLPWHTAYFTSCIHPNTTTGTRHTSHRYISHRYMTYLTLAHCIPHILYSSQQQYWHICAIVHAWPRPLRHPNHLSHTQFHQCISWSNWPALLPARPRHTPALVTGVQRFQRTCTLWLTEL